MANSFAASAFADNFITGFSFVDSIKRANRNEARLEDRLRQEQEERAFQRGRTEESDEQVRENREVAKTSRERTRTRELRRREADVIMSSPNPDRVALQKFADLPEVSAFLRSTSTELTPQERQARADAEFLSAQGPGAEQAQPGAEQAQPGAGLSQQVQGAQVPGPQFAPPKADLTPRELNQLADTDPEAATTIRDSQVAAAPPPQKLDFGGGILVPDTGPSVRGKEIAEGIQRQSNIDIINANWESFVDINDRGGDLFRNLDPTTLVSQYFRDRSTLTDPSAADTRIRPKIQEVITEQRAFLEAARADPESATAGDVRNATRDLSEAYGLVQTMVKTTSPAGNAGTDNRGLPVGGAPTALVDSIIEQTIAAPGEVLLPNPDAARIDRTIASRPVTGKRMSRQQLDVAYRMKKRGEWTHEQYVNYLNTGQPPVAAGKFESFPVDQDTFLVVNGRRILVQAARDKDRLSSGIRNTIGDDALKQLNISAKQFSTKDYPNRGIAVMNTFMAVLADGETQARAAGYDYTNINDVMALWERFNQISVLRDEFDDEYMHNGVAFPDFVKTYGEGAAALFNRDLDTLDRQSIANFFAEASPLTALKKRPSGFYDTIRANAAQAGRNDIANAGDDEIEASLRNEGR